jgi:hypothetical protein
MLLINAYFPSFFPSLFSPFPPLHIYILSDSNKCLLFIFLSVTFLALLTLFPPIFTTHLYLAGNYLINAYCPFFFPSLSSPSHPFSPFFSHLNIASHASNKCVLHIFLSVAFLTLPLYMYSLCILLINAY